MEVVVVNGIFPDLVSDVVCLAVDGSGFYSAAGWSAGEGLGMIELGGESRKDLFFSAWRHRPRLCSPARPLLSSQISLPNFHK